MKFSEVVEQASILLRRKPSRKNNLDKEEAASKLAA
jgi:hypothetical protein